MGRRTPFSSPKSSQKFRVRWTPQLHEALAAAAAALGSDADAVAILEHMGPAAASLSLAGVAGQLQKYRRGLGVVQGGKPQLRRSCSGGGGSARSHHTCWTPHVGARSARMPRGTVSLPADLQDDLLASAGSGHLIDWADFDGCQHDGGSLGMPPLPPAAGMIPCSAAGSMVFSALGATPQTASSIVTSGMPLPALRSAGVGHRLAHHVSMTDGAAGCERMLDGGGCGAFPGIEAFSDADDTFSAVDLDAYLSDSDDGSSLWSTDTPTYPPLAVAPQQAAPIVPTAAFHPAALPPPPPRPPPPEYQQKLAALMAAMHERPGVAPIGLKLDKQAVLRELRLAAA